MKVGDHIPVDVVMRGIFDLRSFQQARPAPTTAANTLKPRADEKIELGELVFRCDATFADIESGIVIDLQSFQRIQHFNVRIECLSYRHCHEFKVEYGRLAAFARCPDNKATAPDNRLAITGDDRWKSAGTSKKVLIFPSKSRHRMPDQANPRVALNRNGS